MVHYILQIAMDAIEARPLESGEVRDVHNFTASPRSKTSGVAPTASGFRVAITTCALFFWFCAGSQAKIGFTTVPCTSVNRKSRP